MKTKLNSFSLLSFFIFTASLVSYANANDAKADQPTDSVGKAYQDYFDGIKSGQAKTTDSVKALREKTLAPAKQKHMESKNEAFEKTKEERKAQTEATRRQIGLGLDQKLKKIVEPTGDETPEANHQTNDQANHPPQPSKTSSTPNPQPFALPKTYGPGRPQYELDGKDVVPEVAFKKKIDRPANSDPVPSSLPSKDVAADEMEFKKSDPNKKSEKGKDIPSLPSLPKSEGTEEVDFKKPQKQ